MKTIRRTAAVAALLLVVAACGDGQVADQIPPAGDGNAAAGTCLEGTVDCNDTPSYGDEPQGGLPPSGDSSGMPIDGGGLSVAEALQTDAAGVLAVHGYYVDDGSGPMLCEVLAESFPPQCGGASIPLADIAAIDPGSIQTNQGVSWTDGEVFLLGEIVDGVFVPTDMSA